MITNLRIMLKKTDKNTAKSYMDQEKARQESRNYSNTLHVIITKKSVCAIGLKPEK